MQYFENEVYETGPSLLEEILMEVFPEKEVLSIEISIPGFEYEFGYNSEVKTIADRIEHCLKIEKDKLKGVKDITVKRPQDAEIIMEIGRGGAKFEKNVANALRACGIKILEVHRTERVKKSIPGCRSVIRYTDIYAQLGGTKLLIETKLGDSQYHRCQKLKDIQLIKERKQRKKGHRRIEAFVIRGARGRKLATPKKITGGKIMKPLSKNVRGAGAKIIR